MRIGYNKIAEEYQIDRQIFENSARYGGNDDTSQLGTQETELVGVLRSALIIHHLSI